MADAAVATRPQAQGATAPLLAVRDLNAWYGESHVLHGISFDVFPGEVVTLLGRNGAGKSTTMKSIMGILPKRTGSIPYEGQEIITLPARVTAGPATGSARGARGIFGSLSVAENLDLPP